jgi:hypothetical protein
MSEVCYRRPFNLMLALFVLGWPAKAGSVDAPPIGGEPVADRALSLVSVDPSGFDHHPSRDAHPLAPLWLLLLLALEVTIFGRPAADRG